MKCISAQSYRLRAAHGTNDYIDLGHVPIRHVKQSLSFWVTPHVGAALEFPTTNVKLPRSEQERHFWDQIQEYRASYDSPRAIPDLAATRKLLQRQQ